MSTTLPTPAGSGTPDRVGPPLSRRLRELPVLRLRSGAPDRDRSRLGPVVAVVGMGLLVQARGYAMARSGDTGTGLVFFFVGLVAIFAVCAWRLLATDTRRRERLATVLVLGLSLTLSSFLLNSLLFTGFDDLLHQATLWQLGQGRRLFAHNSVLPVSPYYPALEVLTMAIRWTTGLPIVVCELAVVLVSRLVLVAVVYLLCERLTRSERGGGIGVLVYALSPQFYAFNSAYGYQTVALAFGCGAIYLLLAAVDRRKPTRSTRYWLALACLGATIVSHHLVGMLTVGLVVVWAAVLAVAARREHRPAARARLAAKTRLVGEAAAVGLVALGAWTAMSATVLASYLGPLLTAAWDGLIATITRSGTDRALFHSSTGAVTPEWQRLLLVLSPVILLVVLLPALWAVVVRKRLRGGLQRFVPVVIALGFAFVLGSRLSSSVSDVGARSSTFVFFGMAVCIAAWFVHRRTRLATPVLVGLAVVCFLGSMILGSGPSSSYTPGPYQVSADQRSVDAPSIAAANWAASHLPAGASIAADRDNSALMASLGHLSPVTALGGQVNVGPMYFDPVFGNYERGLVRKYHIDYLLVDLRLSTGPPGNGYYYEPGETRGVEQLTSGELAKFANVAGVHRIYDNGPIQIYSLAAITGSAPTGSPGGTGRGANWWVLVPAMAVAAVWSRRAWTRRRPYGLEAAVSWILATMCVALAATFLFIPTGIAATPVALVVLGGLLAAGLAEPFRTALARRRRPVDERELFGVVAERAVRRAAGWMRRELWVLFGGACVVVAVAVSVASASSAWVSPTALSIRTHATGASVQVTLAPAAAGADLEVLGSSGAVWSTSVGGTGVHEVSVPAWALRLGTQVALVANGQVVRTVHA